MNILHIYNKNRMDIAAIRNQEGGQALVSSGGIMLLPLNGKFLSKPVRCPVTADSVEKLLVFPDIWDNLRQ
jgi:hypothetical protein